MSPEEPTVARTLLGAIDRGLNDPTPTFAFQRATSIHAHVLDYIGNHFLVALARRPELEDELVFIWREISGQPNIKN